MEREPQPEDEPKYKELKRDPSSPYLKFTVGENEYKVHWGNCTLFRYDEPFGIMNGIYVHTGEGEMDRLIFGCYEELEDLRSRGFPVSAEDTPDEAYQEIYFKWQESLIDMEWQQEAA